MMTLDMTTTFTANFGATHYVFGWGMSEKVLEYAMRYGKTIGLLTSQGSSGQKNFIQELHLKAKRKGLELNHFPMIQANPDVTDIDLLAKQANHCNVLIGLGGGSVLDASKALAVVMPSQQSAREWLNISSVPNHATKLPTILLPTTAGTGSELSFGAILSDRKHSFKGGIRGNKLATEIAIVDPALTLSMPKQLSIETGFDVVTHAIESYLSHNTTPQARMLSLQAITLITRYLPQVKTDSGHQEARTAMAYASSIMGLNLASVGTCLPHRLQYPIGGFLPNSSHPQGLSWIYPTWIKLIYPHVSQDVHHLFTSLGLAKPTSSEHASQIIRQWLENLGLSTKPIKKLDPISLASQVQGNIRVDPLPHPEQYLVRMYEEIFE